MTDGSCQAYVIFPTAEHIVVLAQQLCHSLAFLIAHATVTSCFVQLSDM